MICSKKTSWPGKNFLYQIALFWKLVSHLIFLILKIKNWIKSWGSYSRQKETFCLTTLRRLIFTRPGFYISQGFIFGNQPSEKTYGRGLFLQMGCTKVFCENYSSRLSCIKTFSEDLFSTIKKKYQIFSVLNILHLIVR